MAMWRVLASVPLATFLTVSLANGIELTVLSPQAMKPALSELIPQFERGTGHQVTVIYSSTAAHIKEIEDDKIADVAILYTEQIEELDDDEKLLEDTATPIAKLPLGIIIRKGAPKPDVSTVRSLTNTLLAANLIALGDPETSNRGQYVASLFERLKIADTIRPKMKFFSSGADALNAVANGEADLAIWIASSVDGVRTELAGLLPAQAKKSIAYSVAILSTSPNIEAAKALLAFLSSRETMAVLRAKGIEAP